MLEQYDLSSVKSIFTGAAPLGQETAEDLQAIFPTWAIRQGYGLTETSTVVCTSSVDDIWFGSSGSLVAGIEARIVTIEGTDIDGYDQPGELWVKGPAVVLGYLKNPKATQETFIDGYMRTGDEAVVRKNPKSGHEHIFIVDRLKELIKVNVRKEPAIRRLMQADTAFEKSHADTSRIGPPSRARRARSTSPHAPLGQRLRRHRRAVGPRGRSAQGVCGQVALGWARGLRRHGQARH